MLHKIRTPILAIAFKADSKLPPQVQRTVEHDILALAQIYSTMMERGRYEILWAHIAELCKREVIDLADLLKQQESDQAENKQICSRCGGAHDANIH